ncbi:MAG: hypothetical protein Q7T77_04910 [Sulfuricurvum sp.]|nr:hypothetical protein [Sulfuricurvum sp.]
MHSSKWYWLVLGFIKIIDIFKGGSNNVRNNNSGSGDDKNVDDSGDDGWDSDDGVVGILPKPICDSGVGVGEESTCKREAILRDVNSRAKQRHRGKRRR